MTYAMKPMLPTDKNEQLADKVVELTACTSALAGKIPKGVQDGIGDLVRSMNCYYSNLIEGHNTHPGDIERALHDNYSRDTKRRTLQKEARAHIVTRLLSHAMLLKCGIGSSLWSVSLGLARNADTYKATLAKADSPRRGDLDGRGSLSAQGLFDFTLFFLET